MTSRGWAPLLLAGALLALPAAARAQAAGGAPACGAPAELLESSAPLPAMVAAVRGGALRILVIGTSSVLGPGTSGPAAAWPERLRALLAARRPTLALDLRARGKRGLTTAESGAMLAEELARAPADLVIWVTGTLDAVRALEVDQMVEALDAGLDAIKAAGADAVLVDPQFSRFLRANANMDPYLDALRLAAAAHAVPLLRRWDLMRHWAETDVVDAERAPRKDRVAAADTLNDCLAQAVLALLRDGAGQAGGQSGGQGAGQPRSRPRP